jgi:hypothetical protein
MKTITGIVACLMVALMVVPEHAAAETMTFQEGVSPDIDLYGGGGHHRDTQQ